MLKYVLFALLPMVSYAGQTTEMLVIQNNPKLDRGYVTRLSKVIERTAIEYGIKPTRLAAIFMQESRYNLKAMGPQGCRADKCQDFGISQINKKTAKGYGFDLERLTNDLEYSIRAGAIVLSDFKKRFEHKEKDWWTRYNTSNAGKRSIYKKSVERWTMFKPQDIQTHKKKAKSMEWDELALIILDLEIRRFQIKEKLTSKELKVMDSIIKAYETSKIQKIDKKWTNPEGLYEDVDYVSLLND